MSGVCGNGVLEPPEECDQGPFNHDDELGACRTDCRVQRCGNWSVDEGELCDDGNFVDYDSCPNDCGYSLTRCGDGRHDEEDGEQCDDGDDDNWDGCTLACQQAEWRVNTHLPGDQGSPRVGVAEDGFVIVWIGDGPQGYGVQARLYDADGQPLGEELKLEGGLAEARPWGELLPVRVHRTRGGSFSVTWHFANSYEDRYGLGKQDFLPDGTPHGPASEVVLSPHPGDVAYHELLGLPDGRQAVVWCGIDGIHLQRYTTDGSAVSEPTLLVGTPQQRFAAAMAPDGTVFVAWTELLGAGETKAIRVDADGVARGDAFTLLPAPPQEVDIGYSLLGVSAVGTLALAWQQGTDGTQTSCWYRYYDWSGNPLIPARHCLGNGATETALEGLAMDSQGRVALAFMIQNAVDLPEWGTLPPTHYAQFISPSGEPLSGPSRLVLYPPNHQSGQDIGLANNGTSVMTVAGWHFEGHYHGYPPDSGENGIDVYARRLESPW